MGVNTAKKTGKATKKAKANSSMSKAKARTSGPGAKKSVASQTANSELKEAIIAIGKNIDKSIDRLGEKIDKAILSMTERIASSKEETDAKIAASDAKLAAAFARLDAVVEGTTAELAGLSVSAGRAVESMAFDFFDKRMAFAGVTFDDIECGVNRKKKLPDGKKVQGQYDVVLYNGAAIALIEAKNRVRMEDLDKLINEQMPRFKLFFPQYKDFKFYLGLCGMSFEDGVEETALCKGIGTLKLSGDALEINEIKVKAW